jgi:DNA polymerase-3 subunit delta
MVAISASRVIRYVRRPPAHISGFLVYGSHDGVISEVISRLVASVGNGGDSDTITLSEQDLSTDPDRLAIELRTLPLFGGDKLIRTKAGTRSSAIILDCISEALPTGIKLIVEAGALKKDARLRRTFEQADYLAACPCYEPEPSGIDDLIREELAAASLSVNSHVRQLIQNALGSDYGLARSELQKLVQYAHGQDAIMDEDVEAVLGECSALHVDIVIAAIMSGDSKTAIGQTDRLAASGYSLSAVMSNLLGYLLRTHRLKSAVTSGQSFDIALRQIRPPVHFRQADRLKADVRAVTLGELDEMIECVMTALGQMRRSSRLDEEIATQTLLKLCRTRQRPR